MPGREKSKKVQVWKDKKIIGDVPFPNAWKESVWPVAHYAN